MNTQGPHMRILPEHEGESREEWRTAAVFESPTSTTTATLSSSPQTEATSPSIMKDDMQSDAVSEISLTSARPGGDGNANGSSSDSDGDNQNKTGAGVRKRGSSNKSSTATPWKPTPPFHADPQLALHAIHLCGGRESQAELLRSAFDRVKGGKSELVLVKGESGSGKTFLVEEGLRTYVSRTGYFTKGKFDQLFSNEWTYSAIVESFSDLFDLLLSSPDVEDLRKTILEALGSDVKVMTNMIDNLAYLLGLERAFHSQPTTRQASVRFKVLCRNLLDCLATREHPICIFLDDLQWADPASLSVIHSLVTDKESSHILFVAACRDDEVDILSMLGLRHDPRQSPQRAASGESHSGGSSGGGCGMPHISHISLGNLEVEGVAELLADLLSEAQIEQGLELLADVVVRKTDGNPLFVVKFIETLKEEGLLRCDLTSREWKWNVEEIQENTDVSENILELISSKIQRLGKTVRRVLQNAACLGYQFDMDNLRLVSVAGTNRNEIPSGLAKKHSVSPESFQDAIDFAIKEGLIEKGRKKVYKFSHDRIRSTLYDLLRGRQDELHLGIGRALLEGEPEDELIRLLAVDQLNRGSSCLQREEEQLGLVELNLSAGQLSLSKGAFQNASVFFENGLRMLSDEPWVTHYDLWLNLSRRLVESESSVGNFDKTRTLASDIISHTRTLPETFEAYVALCDSLMMEGNLGESLNLCCGILPDVGVELPQNPSMLTVAMEFARAKLYGTNLPEDRLMTDENKIFAMRLLNTVTQCSFLTNQGEYVAIATLQMIHLSRRYGLSKFSPGAYACYAMVTVLLGQHNEGVRLGEKALALIDTLDAQSESGAITLTLVSNFALHWRRSLRHEIDAQMEAYRIGLETGQIEASFLGAHTGVTLNFFAGNPLPICLEVSENSCREMLEYNQTTWFSITMQYSQMFDNFMGNAESSPTILTGDYMVQEEVESEAHKSKNVLIIRTVRLLRVILACHFNEWELAVEIAQLLYKGSEQAAAHFNYYIFFFYAAFASLVQSSSSTWRLKRKLRRVANGVIKKMKRWVKDGCVNCKPLLALLEAEVLVATGELSKMQTAFDGAIEECRKMEFPHLEAMANERAGNVVPEHRMRYHSSALNLYRSWGAAAKVATLEAKLRPPTDVDPLGITSSTPLTHLMVSSHPELPSTMSRGSLCS